jgi:hypothetical protein
LLFWEYSVTYKNCQYRQFFASDVLHQFHPARKIEKEKRKKEFGPHYYNDMYIQKSNTTQYLTSKFVEMHYVKDNTTLEIL